MVRRPVGNRSGTEHSPRSSPSRRFAWGEACASVRGVTRTMGLPALQITKLSPAAASSTRRDRWVFASCMFTWRIMTLVAVTQLSRLIDDLRRTLVWSSLATVQGSVRNAQKRGHVLHAI